METTQAPNWAQLLQRLREQLGESQEQFGERFGVTKMSISRWERGESEPTPDNIRTLANIDGGEQIVREFYGLEQ